MIEIEIVPTVLDHIKELSETMREKDQAEARAMGYDPKKALFYSYKFSVLRRTCLVDGRVAAVWGLGGTPLGLVGQPFFVTGHEANKVSPIRFARIYLKELESMKNLFPILENYVHSDYEGAVGMLQIAGFTLSEPIDVNGYKFQRFSMVNI